MKAFAALLDRLYFTHSNLAKEAVLLEYLRVTPDPDRGYALAIIAGELNFAFFKRALVRDMITQQVDPDLFEMSYDYVGETSETVAHLWRPTGEAIELPPLHEVIETFQSSNKLQVREYLTTLLNSATTSERWALLKLGMGGLRIGISTRFVKKVLANMGNVDVQEIETLWHSLTPPYEDLFAWLEGRAHKPEALSQGRFHPVMLSHPIADNELPTIKPEEFIAEWKYDGIRIQLSCGGGEHALYTRTGDNISHSFPEIVSRAPDNAVIDGELVVMKEGVLGSFNELQQRLGKKKPSKALIDQYPTAIIAYDALSLEGADLRHLPLHERRAQLEQWLTQRQPAGITLSESLPYSNFDELYALRTKADRHKNPLIEGLMLKRLDSTYVAGRPKGAWYKWKRDPLMVDAVLMYAERGHGIRSSFYSDYTFGLWKGNELLPIGKAYSGFTDKELKELDKWIRNHTTNRFGPVREVSKEMVFEVAFDSAHPSPRHKSGYALRFPRINRIRWDKPAQEADHMKALEQFIHNNSGK